MSERANRVGDLHDANDLYSGDGRRRRRAVHRRRPPVKIGPGGRINRVGILAIAVIELQHVAGIRTVKITPHIHGLLNSTQVGLPVNGSRGFPSAEWERVLPSDES